MDVIGLIVPGTMSLWRWYNLPGTDPVVAGLAYSWDGARHHLWFTDSGAGHVGLLVIDETGKLVATRRHRLSSANSVPIGIAVDANQRVWIAEYGSKMIANWYPPYSHDIFLPLLFK
jgi:streptogramin lyase